MTARILQFRKPQAMHEVTLLPLSLQCVSGRRQPKVYDNDARRRFLLRFLPLARHNTFNWQGLVR